MVTALHGDAICVIYQESRPDECRILSSQQDNHFGHVSVQEGACGGSQDAAGAVGEGAQRVWAGIPDPRVLWDKSGRQVRTPFCNNAMPLPQTTFNFPSQCIQPGSIQLSY